MRNVQGLLTHREQALILLLRPIVPWKDNPFHWPYHRRNRQRGRMDDPVTMKAVAMFTQTVTRALFPLGLDQRTVVLAEDQGAGPI